MDIQTDGSRSYYVSTTLKIFFKILVWMSAVGLILYSLYRFYIVFYLYDVVPKDMRRMTYYQLTSGLFIIGYYLFSKAELESTITQLRPTMLEELDGIPDYKNKIRSITQLYMRNYVVIQTLLAILILGGMYAIFNLTGFIRFLGWVITILGIIYANHNFTQDPIDLLYTERYEKLIYKYE